MGSYHDHYGNRRKSPGARFTVGRDHHGWWVVHDRLDRIGGYFVSEDAAQHFAAEEAGHDVSAVSKAKIDADVELFHDEPRYDASIGRTILDNNRRLKTQRKGPGQ